MGDPVSVGIAAIGGIFASLLAPKPAAAATPPTEAAPPPPASSPNPSPSQSGPGVGQPSFLSSAATAAPAASATSGQKSLLGQ